MLHTAEWWNKLTSSSWYIYIAIVFGSKALHFAISYQLVWNRHLRQGLNMRCVQSFLTRFGITREIASNLSSINFANLYYLYSFSIHIYLEYTYHHRNFTQSSRSTFMLHTTAFCIPQRPDHVHISIKNLWLKNNNNIYMYGDLWHHTTGQ